MIIRRFENWDLLHISTLVLEREEIHIWCIRWTKITAWILDHWNVMCDDEKNAAQKFIKHDDQMRYAVGKIMSRLILARYMNISERNILISKNKYGKPFIRQLEMEEPIQYNISHSGEFVLLAVTKYSEIGIDIELLRELPDYLEIAQTVFSPEEAEIIKDSNSPNIFFCYWTAKEAYVKALGTGLFTNLKLFMIERNEIIDCGGRKKEWKLIRLYIAENYVSHIAVKLEYIEESNEKFREENMDF